MFFASVERVAAPMAMPPKSPAIMNPFIFPRSFLSVTSMAQASVETSRNPMPHCAMMRMRMNSVSCVDGLIM